MMVLLAFFPFRLNMLAIPVSGHLLRAQPNCIVYTRIATIPHNYYALSPHCLFSSLSHRGYWDFNHDPAWDDQESMHMPTPEVQDSRVWRSKAGGLSHILSVNSLSWFFLWYYLTANPIAILNLKKNQTEDCHIN